MITHVTIELTYRCPYECPFCLNPVGGDAHLPLPLILRALEEAADLGALRAVLTGGEPTSHGGFLAALKRAHEVGLSAMTITVGEKLSERSFAEACAPFLSLAQVSVHGSATHSNAALVNGRRDIYPKQVAAVNNLVELGVAVRINMVVTPQNHQDINGHVEKFYSMGVRQFQFAPVYRLGSGAGQERLLLSATQWVEAANAIQAARDRFSSARFMTEINTNGVSAGSSFLDGLCVSADGLVRPFESAPDVAAAPYQSIRNSSLAENWKDSPAISFWRENWKALRTEFHANAVPAWSEMTNQLEAARE